MLCAVAPCTRVKKQYCHPSTEADLDLTNGVDICGDRVVEGNAIIGKRDILQYTGGEWVFEKVVYVSLRLPRHTQYYSTDWCGRCVGLVAVCVARFGGQNPERSIKKTPAFRKC